MGRTRGGLPNLLLRVMLKKKKDQESEYATSGVCMPVEDEATVRTDDRTRNELAPVIDKLEARETNKNDLNMLVDS